MPRCIRPVRVGILAGSFIQDRRDDPTDSHRGIFNTLDFGLASKIFGSQSALTRFLGRNPTYHPIGKKICGRPIGGFRDGSSRSRASR